MHGPVWLNSVGLVGVLVGGGPLKWHILVLIPGSMLGHMRLNLMGRVLILQMQPNLSCHAALHVPLVMSGLANAVNSGCSTTYDNQQHRELQFYAFMLQTLQTNTCNLRHEQGQGERQISLHGKCWCHQIWRCCVEEGQAAWVPCVPRGGHGSHCHKQIDPQTSHHCLQYNKQWS